MKTFEKEILVTLLVLLIAALAATLYTRDWADSPRRLYVDTMHAAHKDQLVDTRALDTAQQLAQLAVTHWEKDYAAEALRLADHSVDLAFSAALEDARENPPAETPETRELSNRVVALEAQVSADTDRVTQLTAQLAKAAANKKDAQQEDLDLANAQLALDKDELDDAHQDLTRAGGDKRALIQQQLDEHEASETHTSKAPQAANAAARPMVQIMELSNNQDADAMVSALRRHGYNVAVSRDPQDSMLHLEVGPFADNSAAQAMRQRLLLEGYNATVK